MAANVDAIERETFAGGVRLAVKAMQVLGKPAYKSDRAGKLFTRYDERVLNDMFPHWRKENLAEYQRIVRDRTALEEDLLRRDISSLMGAAHAGDSWDEEITDRETYEREQAPKAAE
jgi:glutathione-regulated potassium-efflux system ancillary protein KefC